jgi:hypothetical protein
MHANPDAFGKEFHEDKPMVYEYLNKVRIARKWKEADYLAKERELLITAVELNVDCMAFPVTNDWRGRFCRRRLLVGS